MRRALVGLVLLVALGGCKKGTTEAPADPGPPPLGEPEANRGTAACAAYVAKVCDCASHAGGDPALDGECALARAMPGALELSIKAARAPGEASAEDRAVILGNTRKIVKQCIEGTARIATRSCAPVPPAAAPVPAP